MKSIIYTFVAITLTCSPYVQAQSLDDINELTLEDIMNLGVVTGASKYEQKVSEAPADVTLITAEEIRAGAYRTLYEVLNTVPGIYMRDDRSYNYIGVRGLNRPGEYNARVLITVDGHRMNENIYDSVGFKEDGPIALSLIDRIEVIRGPASSLYGNNAFFGVINIVSKSAAKLKGLSTQLSYGSFNAQRATVNYGHPGEGNNGWVIGAEGVDIEGPELTMENLGKVKKGLDFTRTARAYFSYNKGDFDLRSNFNSRTKGIPTSAYGTVFNEQNPTRDQRFYLDAGYKFHFSETSQLEARTHFDDYRYHEVSVYDTPPLYTNRDEANGQWWGVDLKYSNELSANNKLVVGVDYVQHMSQESVNYDVDPYASYIDVSRKPKNWGVFLQDEARLNKKFVLNTSLRYDSVQNIEVGTEEVEHDNLAPRVALIFAHSDKTTTKFIYGQAFRAANLSEVKTSNPKIKPETIDSYELIWNSSINSNVNLGLSASAYKIKDLISADPATTWPNEVYINSDVDATAYAAELNFKLSKSLTGRLAYSVQEVEDAATGKELTNSPSGVGKLNLSQKVTDNISVSTDIQYLSDTKDELAQTVEAYTVVNLAVVAKNVFSVNDLGVSLRVANALDKEYYAATDNLITQTHKSVQQDEVNADLKVSYSF